MSTPEVQNYAYCLSVETNLHLNNTLNDTLAITHRNTAHLLHKL